MNPFLLFIKNFIDYGIIRPILTIVVLLWVGDSDVGDWLKIVVKNVLILLVIIAVIVGVVMLVFHH